MVIYQIKYNMGIKGVSVFQVDPLGSLIKTVVLDVEYCEAKKSYGFCTFVSLY